MRRERLVERPEVGPEVAAHHDAGAVLRGVQHRRHRRHESAGGVADRGPCVAVRQHPEVLGDEVRDVAGQPRLHLRLPRPAVHALGVDTPRDLHLGHHHDGGAQPVRVDLRLDLVADVEDLDPAQRCTRVAVEGLEHRVPHARRDRGRVAGGQLDQDLAGEAAERTVHRVGHEPGRADAAAERRCVAGDSRRPAADRDVRRGRPHLPRDAARSARRARQCPAQVAPAGEEQVRRVHLGGCGEQHEQVDHPQGHDPSGHMPGRAGCQPRPDHDEADERGDGQHDDPVEEEGSGERHGDLLGVRLVVRQGPSSQAPAKSSLLAAC